MPGGEREIKHRFHVGQVNDHFRADDAQILRDGVGAVGMVLDAHGQGAGAAKIFGGTVGGGVPGVGVTGMSLRLSPWAA